MPETSYIILSVSLLLMVVALLPLLWQVWRTAKNAAETLETLNKSLPGILKSLEISTTNIEGITCTVKQEAEAVVLLSRKIRAIFELAKGVEGLLQQGLNNLPLINSLRTVRGLVKGVKVFFDVFLNKETDYRQEE